MLSADVVAHLSLEDLRDIRLFLTRSRKAAEIEMLANWRNMRGLKLPPNTCAVCSTKSFLGPLCFDHMDGRSMSRMWTDYIDPKRRNVAKIEAFLYAKLNPGEDEDER